jgi:hypothetical protein
MVKPRIVALFSQCRNYRTCGVTGACFADAGCVDELHGCAPASRFGHRRSAPAACASSGSESSLRRPFPHASLRFALTPRAPLRQACKDELVSASLPRAFGRKNARCTAEQAAVCEGTCLCETSRRLANVHSVLPVHSDSCRCIRLGITKLANNDRNLGIQRKKSSLAKGLFLKAACPFSIK